MALSEHERRALEQLEMQFKEDAPNFAYATDAEPAPGRSALRIIIGLRTAMTGIAILLLGISLNETPAGITIGMIGFTALLAGGYVATKHRDNL